MGGLGEKTKRQITNAINKYGSTHGIIISNTTDVITKEDNVIYIPNKDLFIIINRLN